MAEDKKKEIAVIEITEEYMKDRLYEFRGKKVMLDSDLAEIYGYETKNFKRQVKNNIAKFEGDDFMFELNDEEVENLSRCKNFTLNMGRGSNIKYKPYVFTNIFCFMFAVQKIHRKIHATIFITPQKWSIPLFPSVCHNTLYTYKSSAH